jgi:hypothetical protein
MAFAINIGKKKQYSLIYMEGGGSTFLYLGTSQIINDTPPPPKTRK